VGYLVWERRKKLKAEFQNLTGDQIRDLRLSGTEVAEERRMPLLGFTGDTAPEGLDANPDLYEAKVLITEMSFVAPGHRKEKIHKHGHMHLDDFVERQRRFHNELIIAAHFSTRYHDKQVVHYVKKSLPDMLGGRLHLWL
jgi:ribonuclease Z